MKNLHDIINKYDISVKRQKFITRWQEAISRWNFSYFFDVLYISFGVPRKYLKGIGNDSKVKVEGVVLLVLITAFLEF